MITLFQLIAQIETAQNNWALRFEPAQFARFNDPKNPIQIHSIKNAILTRIMKTNKCTLPTAQIIFSCSFGAVQEMGFNLYGRFNYQNTVGEFLAAGIDQRSAFEHFISDNQLSEITVDALASQPLQRLKFAIKYNGSIAYCKPMIAALQHFGYTVK